MRGFLTTMRVLLLLAAIWGAVGTIAYFAGVLPPMRGAWAERLGLAREERVTLPDGHADAGAPDAAPARTDAGARDAASDAVPVESRSALAIEACPPDVAEPVLTALRILGDEPRFVLGCGPHVDLLTIDRTASPPRIVRIASLEAVSDAPSSTSRLASAVAGDVTADGQNDLVLAFLSFDRNDTLRGGKLFLLPGDPYGGFDAPVVLAPIAAISIALAELDGAAGLDVVALHRPDAHGRRPTEAWTFAGGPAPARRARLEAGRGAESIAASDVDRDGKVDVAIASASGLRILFGDGAGTFDRQAVRLERDGLKRLVALDLDGDGGTDLAMEGASFGRLRPAARAALAIDAVEAPRDLHGLVVFDIEGDGRDEALGISGDGIVRIRDKDGSLEIGPWLDLLLSAGTPRALAVQSSATANTVDALVLLRPPGPDTPWRLALADAVGATAATFDVGTPGRMTAAPFVLRVELR